MADRRERLRSIHRALLARYGPQGWWPSESAFETMIGAVLTQGTAWRNAEVAVGRFRAAGALDPASVAELGVGRLEALARPAGFHRRKAATIRELAALARSCAGGLPALLGLETTVLRDRLLAIRGVGRETADAILLYAAGRPIFVVDEYARRLVERHGLAPAGASYDDVRALFEAALPPDPVLLGECHALVVRVGKERCRPTPLCTGCPAAFDLMQRRRGRGD